MLGWHFTDGAELRDGRALPPVGETLTYDGPLKLCYSGLHASEDILDALRYAPGTLLHRVECGGKVVEGFDKLVCRERTILWSLEAKPVLRAFARWCALRVIDKWAAPEVVVRYLRHGREADRDAARAAAWAAATARSLRRAGLLRRRSRREGEDV